MTELNLGLLGVVGNAFPRVIRTNLVSDKPAEAVDRSWEPSSGGDVGVCWEGFKGC